MGFERAIQLAEDAAMNVSLERLYNSSPIWIQNLMTTVYGYNLHRQRYSDNFQRHLAEVRETQWWPAERLEALQNERLAALVRHAYAYTRYYRQLFDRLGLKPKDITCKDDLCKMPILSKDDLREHFDDIVARNIPRRRIFVDHTSGTTGTPRTLHIDLNCLQYNFALLARAREWAGVDCLPRRASLRGRLIVPNEQEEPPFWRYNRIEDQLLLSSYHISAETILVYAERLRHFKPQLLDGYPSAVYTLARLMQLQGLDNFHPQAVMTDSETLLAYQRQCIEQQFGCKVYDWYGTAELAFSAGQCEQGNYHLNAEFGIVESVQNGERVGQGEIGHVVCTGLLNYAMPLIRYDVGDTAIFSDEKCPCGRDLQVMNSVEGRVEDIIVTPEGRMVGRLDPVFKEVQNVLEAQILQDSLDTVRVKVVCAEGYNEVDSLNLKDALRKRLGYQMQIELEFVNLIPRTEAGKFRFVISNVETGWSG